MIITYNIVYCVCDEEFDSFCCRFTTMSRVMDPGGYSAWKLMGCAAGRWKLDPKRSRKKLNLGPKRSIFVKIGSFYTPKDSFAVGGWEKVPQKDRARSCQSEKRGSKPRHICITHHIGSTPPPPPGVMEHGGCRIASPAWQTKSIGARRQYSQATANNVLPLLTDSPAFLTRPPNIAHSAWMHGTLWKCDIYEFNGLRNRLYRYTTLQ